MTTQLNNLALSVNGQQIAYTADSLDYTSGFGTYMIRAAVVGGDLTEDIFSEDISTKFSTVKFSMPTTVTNEALLLDWKFNKQDNFITIQGTIDGTNFTKSFLSATIINDPEVKIATEGNIELEWRTRPVK